MSGASVYEAEAAGRAFLPELASAAPGFSALLVPRLWRAPEDVRTLLAAVLSASAYRTGRVDLFDEAIGLLRQCVSTRRTAETLNSLGGALVVRHSDTGDLPALDEAVTLLHEAAATANPSRRSWAKYRSDLGRALLLRAQATGSTDDLSAAQQAMQEGIDATDEDDPDRADRQFQLALAPLQMDPESLEPLEFRRIADLARKAATRPNSTDQDRLHAATIWGAAAAACEDWNGAIAGYQTAIALLPVVAWHGLSSSDRQWLLSEWTGLANDAAAAAITTDDARLAVELLEHGRAVLWTQLLEERLAPQLAEDSPDLLPALTQIGVQLATLDDRPTPPTRGRTTEWWQAAERRMALAREWDALAAKGRQLPGPQRFLLPRRYDELEAETNGPVVLVNISAYRCDALIINGGPPQLIPLPDLTESDLEDHLTCVYGAYQRAKHDWVARPSLQHNLNNALGWLWDVAAEPILDALGYVTPRDQDQLLPRIWWCPTGPLALLPLHAAGHHTSGRDTVIDRAISSYTTTLHTLQRAHRPATLHHGSRLLMVDVPKAAHQPPLPSASIEADAIGQRLPNHDRLTGPWATSSAVLAALRTHPYVHFACHGTPAPDPTQSSLHLYDGPLTVADISALHLPDAALAYLSACETAVPDQNLSDEAIHPAAALQAAGYRHVIATLWNVQSRQAGRVADSVYAHLTTPTNQLTLTHTAQALHNTIRSLRDKERYPSGVWAAYVHYGP